MWDAGYLSAFGWGYLSAFGWGTLFFMSSAWKHVGRTVTCQMFCLRSGCFRTTSAQRRTSPAFPPSTASSATKPWPIAVVSTLVCLNREMWVPHSACCLVFSSIHTPLLTVEHVYVFLSVSVYVSTYVWLSFPMLIFPLPVFYNSSKSGSDQLNGRVDDTSMLYAFLFKTFLLQMQHQRDWLFENVCFWCLCMLSVCCICIWTDSVDLTETVRAVLTYENSSEMCICMLITKFDSPEVILFNWQTGP